MSNTRLNDNCNSLQFPFLLFVAPSGGENTTVVEEIALRQGVSKFVIGLMRQYTSTGS